MTYRGYQITPLPRRTRTGRYGVEVRITRRAAGRTRTSTFLAEDGIEYILETEAAKEALNLGRNLIERGLTDF